MAADVDFFLYFDPQQWSFKTIKSTKKCATHLNLESVNKSKTIGKKYNTILNYINIILQAVLVKLF
jgi:hypothetical protein